MAEAMGYCYGYRFAARFSRFALCSPGPWPVFVIWGRLAYSRAVCSTGRQDRAFFPALGLACEDERTVLPSRAAGLAVGGDFRGDGFPIAMLWAEKLGLVLGDKITVWVDRQPGRAALAVAIPVAHGFNRGRGGLCGWAVCTRKGVCGGPGGAKPPNSIGQIQGNSRISPETAGTASLTG